MKFSEVIAALEDGKKLTCEGDPDGSYVQLVTPEAHLRPQVVKVWPDGSWTRGHLKFDGSMRDKWRVLDS